MPTHPPLASPPSFRSGGRRSWSVPTLLAAAALSLGACQAVARHAVAKEVKPNIVIFLADDLGSADVPWRGSKNVMPVLDGLAKQSVVLDVHYVHPMCSPTRAALLSGRAASRFGCTGAQNNRVYPFGTTTLASALKSVGYATAITGKWHLGSRSDWGPNLFGFDYSYGSLAGGVGPYDHSYKTGPFAPTWHRNCELIQEEGHVTDLIAAEVERFVARQTKDKPFFLYVPFTAVHIPIDEPEKYLSQNSHYDDPGERLTAAAATHMDEAVGRVLSAVDKAGLRENTLVLFFSDNGGHDTTNNADPKYPGTYPKMKVAGRNDPLRGYKGSLYDGGIRSTALVHWPAQLKPRTVKSPIHVADWMPTFCALAGFTPKEVLKWDGRDVGAMLRGDEASPSPRVMYWKGVGDRERAIRHGDWKLIVGGDGRRIELFHLADDPNETTNLAAREPERVKELRALLKQAAAADNDARVPPEE